MQKNCGLIGILSLEDLLLPVCNVMVARRISNIIVIVLAPAPFLNFTNRGVNAAHVCSKGSLVY